MERPRPTPTATPSADGTDDRRPDETVVVVVPVKSFRLAKARLGGRLDGEQRARLARRMATIVVRAATPLPVLVVAGDAEVATWARSEGCDVVTDPAGGLDRAAAAGVTEARMLGASRVAVVHADLPRAEGLAELVRSAPSEVVLVPDRHGDGTNVCVVPARSAFRFAYGEGSCARHLREALRCGLTVEVMHHDGLAHDVDELEDLDLLDELDELLGEHHPRPDPDAAVATTEG